MQFEVVPKPAAGRGRAIGTAVLLLVAGVLATTSLAFPLWQISYHLFYADYHYDEICRGVTGGNGYCSSYGDYERLVGSSNDTGIIDLAFTVGLTGDLAMAGGLVSVGSSIVVLVTNRMTSASVFWRRLQLCLPVAASALLITSLVAEVVGVTFSLMSSGNPSPCSPKFIATCGATTWGPGNGWYLILLGALLAVAATLLIARFRRRTLIAGFKSGGGSTP